MVPRLLRVRLYRFGPSVEVVRGHFRLVLAGEDAHLETCHTRSAIGDLHAGSCQIVEVLKDNFVRIDESGHFLRSLAGRNKF